MIPKIKLIKNPKTGLIIPEKWKDIKGYKEFYEVSNYGRVKSLYRFFFRGYFSSEKSASISYKMAVKKFRIANKYVV